MHACSGNLRTKFHTLSFINNGEKLGVLPVVFFQFWCETVFTHKHNSSHDLIELSHSNLGLSTLELKAVILSRRAMVDQARQGLCYQRET